MWSTRSRTKCRARSTSLWVHPNLFWQLSRDRSLHGLVMSHAMTASLKPSFRAPWRVGDALFHRGNAGWTASKSGHTCPCQNCQQGSSAEKTGGRSLLTFSSCLPIMLTKICLERTKNTCTECKKMVLCQYGWFS